jgi:transcriptional regulator with XRE-family HTH domain
MTAHVSGSTSERCTIQRTIMHRMSVPAEIAARVRAERARRRWTLDALAARSGISRRLLVQIEQGAANPSLATLLKLAAALGIALTELVADEPEAAPVGIVAAADELTLWSTPAGSSARLLVGHGPLELWAWVLAAGDRRDSEPHRPGSLELLKVHTGSVSLEVGEHRVEVRDGAWLNATLPHAYANRGASPATFTLVVLEPA